MKKISIKQLLASNARAMAYQMHMQKRLLLILVAFFSFQMVSYAAANPTKDNILNVGSGVSIAMAGAGLVNLEEVSDRDTAGNQIGYKLYYVRTDQIDTTQAWPTANAGREMGTIPLKAGEYMHYLYSHNDPAELSKGEKADLTTNVTSTMDIVLGGNSASVLTFLEENAGRKFILFWYDNVDKRWMTGGNIYKPYTLKTFERGNNKDGKYGKLTFESNGFDQPHIYTGTILEQAPSNLVADATELVITPGQDAYNIPNGTAAAAAIATMSGITANDVGRVITLYGAGTTFPATISDSANFILYNSATWTAKAGSKLVLRIYDTLTLIEVEGSRVQIP